jgi:hypothetical protein
MNQTAQLGDRTLNSPGRLLLVSDVARQHQRSAALVLDAGRDRLQPVPAPGRQRHGRALGGQGGCGGRADSARSSGHQRDGPIQNSLHPKTHPLPVTAFTQPPPTVAASSAGPACMTTHNNRRRSHLPGLARALSLGSGECIH